MAAESRAEMFWGCNIQVNIALEKSLLAQNAEKYDIEQDEALENILHNTSTVLLS